jgi:hypothetical protein
MFCWSHGMCYQNSSNSRIHNSTISSKALCFSQLRPQLFYLLVYGSADVKFPDFGK